MPEIQGQLNIHIERTIRVTITLPTTHLYKFMEEFGKEFKEDYLIMNGIATRIRSVDKYGIDGLSRNGASAFTHFTILENEEKQLSEFFKKFAAKHEMELPHLRISEDPLDPKVPTGHEEH